jgi:hypothetical protein
MQPTFSHVMALILGIPRSSLETASMSPLTSVDNRWLTTKETQVVVLSQFRGRSLAAKAF